MKLHRIASRLIPAALLTFGLLAVAGQAFAQNSTAWNFGEKSVAFRHAGAGSTYPGGGRIYNTAGSWLYAYQDSAFISHTVEAAVSTLRADTTATFGIGTLGDTGLEDWCAVFPPTVTAGGALDSVWAFTVMIRPAQSNGVIGALTTAIGDSVIATLQATYDGGTTWKNITSSSVGTINYQAGGTNLSTLNNCLAQQVNSVFFASSTASQSAVSIGNCVQIGNPLFRVILSQEDWNGAVELAIRYPKIIRNTKGS